MRHRPENIYNRLARPELLAKELPANTVIRLKKGRTEAIPFPFSTALEMLNNSGFVGDANVALKKSSPEHPIESGNYLYWLNPQAKEK